LHVGNMVADEAFFITGVCSFNLTKAPVLIIRARPVHRQQAIPIPRILDPLWS
jgi:hypothetical protein